MVMADPSTSALVPHVVEGVVEAGREYRKGNWTLHETVVLIAAKKLDDERRLKGGDKEKNKTAELRWKWVENYCWRNGCQRNQNQCNDKWDNLLREYKKVRDYELKLKPDQQSYWQLDKHERKEKGLPSNLLFQVYEALHDVVDKRYPPRLSATLEDKATAIPQRTPGPSGVPLQHSSEPSGSNSDSEGSDIPASQAKRPKVGKGLGSAIAKSTSELAQTLLVCEDKKDRRHRELLGVEERKLHIENTKAELSREGMTGLIAAVNNLANAILSLAPEQNPTAGH